jgi:hypothetical protein
LKVPKPVNGGVEIFPNEGVAKESNPEKGFGDRIVEQFEKFRIVEQSEEFRIVEQFEKFRIVEQSEEFRIVNL